MRVEGSSRCGEVLFWRKRRRSGDDVCETTEIGGGERREKKETRSRCFEVCLTYISDVDRLQT